MTQLIILRNDIQLNISRTVHLCNKLSLLWLSKLIKDHSLPTLSPEYTRLRSYKIVNDHGLPFLKDGEIGKKVVNLYINNQLCKWSKEAFKKGEDYFYYKKNADGDFEKVDEDDVSYYCEVCFDLERKVVEDWIGDNCPQKICACSKSQLESRLGYVRELGLKMDKDFFTYFTDFVVGVGFRPLDDELVEKISVGLNTL